MGNRNSSAELENQPEKVLDLAGRIDALNQASLARQEQEIEESADQAARIRNRRDAHASPAGVCDRDIQYGVTCFGWIKSRRQRGSALRRRSKNSGVYPTSWCEYRRRKEKRFLESFTTKWARY